MQKHVFGLGYPSLPVMSIEEFYQQRARNRWYHNTVPESNSLMARALKDGEELLTKEEDEAMQAIEKQQWVDYGMASPSPLPQPPAPPTLDEIVNAISAQLQLLASVIKEKGTNVPNLQECLDATLQQAEWFKEAVEEKVETLVDDMDHSYEIESVVLFNISGNLTVGEPRSPEVNNRPV
jgi:hypothetical protein